MVRGTTGLVVPDLEALLKRLEYAKKFLEGTKFSYKQVGNVVETTCPWGNRIRVHGPEPENFGPLRLGMPYVEVRRPGRHRAVGDRAFLYRDPRRHRRRVERRARTVCLGEHVGRQQGDLPRDRARSCREYDGHHIQITLADFSGPHKKLVERGLITEESDQHQYRFVDIVDVDTNKSLFADRARDAQHASSDVQPDATSTGTRT